MSKKLKLAACGLLVSAAFATQATSAPRCPKPQSFSGGCIQVVVWAKNPTTGTCCEYPNPCSAPTGWTTYYSQAECEAAS